MKQSYLSDKLSNCCEIDSYSISLCNEEEKQVLKKFLPECKSVIILAHHIKRALEWQWFPFESERNHVICPAELHSKCEAETIMSLLNKEGYRSLSIPYPGISGVRFKNLASKTGLGKVGDSFLFLHRKWGPWTQLKVIITTAEISENMDSCGDICIHCGICKASCPVNAIKDDTLLGLKCSEYQGKQDAILGIKGSYIVKCDECARNCPIGHAPEKITLNR